MANVQSVDAYRFNILLDVPLSAKMLTFIRNKKVPVRKVDGRKNRVLVRRMTPSDLVASLLTKALDGVEVDTEGKRWIEQTMARNWKQREKAIARGIANRKAPKDKLKPGRVAGKYYPKYEEARKARLEKKAKSPKAVKPVEKRKVGRPPKSKTGKVSK